MTLYGKANVWTGGEETGDALDIIPSLGRSKVSDKPRRKKEREISGRLVGVIKAYKLDRGFGFIRCGKEEYFFHRSAFGSGLDYVIKGEQVHFDIGTDRNGRQVAINVTLLAAN